MMSRHERAWQKLLPLAVRTKESQAASSPDAMGLTSTRSGRSGAAGRGAPLTTCSSYPRWA
jgi:hypothetical protein